VNVEEHEHAMDMLFTDYDFRRIERDELDAQSERSERWRWETTSETDPE